MKRRFTILTAALALLVSLAIPMGMWGQTRTTQTVVLDFENGESTTDWTMTYVTNSNTAISAYHGSKYSANNGSSAMWKYNTLIANPQSLTCYVSKTTTNTKTSTWYIQVSSDGSTWQNAASRDATNMAKGEWVEFSADLSSYSDVYVQIKYDGSSAVRALDYITLVYDDGNTPSTDPEITIAPNSITLGDVLVGDQASTTFSVSQSNLTSGITLSVDNGSLSPSSIAQGAAATTVTWTYTPTTAGAISATVTATSGTTTETLAISGTAIAPVEGYDVDFEYATDMYPNWTFDNMTTYQTGSITAHGGTYYGTTGGKATASITTTSTVANPGTLTCYVSKQSGNTSSSTWYIQVSENGSTWTEVESHSATSMSQGSWVEFTADLTDYTNVYVRVYYNGSTAIRNIDDLTLTTVEPSSDPSITANGVTIPYDATSGSFNYTINNPVQGGYLTVDENVSWISDPMADNGVVIFNTETNPNTVSREGIIRMRYLYDGEILIHNVTITQTAAPVIYSSIPALFEAATDTETSVLVTFNNWVVSGVSTNGKNVFVTDNNGNGFVIYGTDMNNDYAVGDILSGTAVSCTLKKYNGFAELINLNAEDLTITSGGTVSTANVAMADLAGVNTGALVHYEGLICSVNNNKYYLTDGTTTLQVYNAIYAFEALEDGETYNITGIYQQYNNTKEILPRSADDIEEVVSTEPSVTVTPNTINAPFAGAEGTLALTYENIEEFISFDYYFCDANGNELEDTDPDYPGDWIYAEINDENEAYTLSYIIDANDGAARTAYMKVYTFDDNVEEVYAIVTVNQAQYVVDYATLPFAFNGGKNAIEETNGLTQSGLASDYADENTKLKFDSTDDYVILKINERPGTLTFNIKGNSFSGGTFKVQTSADGVSYSDLETYTTFGNNETYEEEFDNLGENVRYIKWIYTNKSSGNVGLGNIALAEYVAPALVASITVNPDEVNVDAEEHDGTLDLTYENLTITDMTDFDIQFCDANGDELSEEPDWIEVLVAEQDPTIGEGYVVSYYMVENEGPDARTAYFKVYAMDDETNLVYSNLVTISQAAPVAPATGDAYALYTGELVEGDYLIVYDGGAMNTTVTNDRLQYEDVIVNNDVIVTDNAAIVWHIAPSGQYWTIYNANAEAYAASTGAKNKAQMLSDGTDDKALWTVSGTETYEFVNKKNTANNVNANLRKNDTYGFACYATGTGGALSLYKKVALPINGYGDNSNPGGYYLIASPLGTINPANVTGMLSDTYDLYYFDQEGDNDGNEWINYKGGSFNLEPGTGYLYAHNSTITLNFTGTPIEGPTYEVTLTKNESARFKGWNLVGNPFTKTAYVDNTHNAYYTMDGDGALFVPVTGNSVDPMEGIFVVAKSDEEIITFSTTNPNEVKCSTLALNLSQGQSLLDRAIVRFDEGSQLPKLQFNQNSTKVYIPMDDKDYAVVRAEEMGEMPVNFKAESNGTYSLNFGMDNVEFAYLHLIDNLTGNEVDLLQTPSYSFEAKTTDYENRFKLVFATGDNSNEDNFAYFSNGSFVINNEGNATLQVIDITGRIVKSESVNGCANVNVNGSAGVYMLRLVNGDNVKVQKVVVK